MAIIHHEDVKYQRDVKYFKAEEVSLFQGLKKYISRVIKIHRLREVRVLTGFTRLESAEPDEVANNSDNSEDDSSKE